ATADVNELFSDGINLHGHVQQNPVAPRDPSGLVVSLFVPGAGACIRGALAAVVSEYAANQEWDAQWAGDWETGDDWHSRLDSTSIDFAIMRGVYGAFWMGIPGTDIAFNPLDAFAGRFGQRMIRVGGLVGHLSGRLHIKV